MNESKEITEIYCFVSVGDEGEGIIAQSMEDPETGETMMMPFYCASKEMMEKLKLSAKIISILFNVKIKVIKFTKREEIEVI